jgi:hypothetical protein
VSKTTILVKDKTRDRLKYTGHKGQTYDELINYLIDIKIMNQDSLDRGFESLKSSESRST